MRGKIIEVILDIKNDFISGEELSKGLGISRTAICKYMKTLKEEGYNIEYVNRKGYRLIEDPKDLLTYQNISHKLNTNNYAKKVALQKPEGTVIISEEQTKGKGRVGRQWHSKSKDGIWMSIILKPDMIPQKATFITSIAGASIAKALNDLGVKTTIKWPNDIIINNKKVAGILTELSAEIEKINYIVLGIGINVKTMEFSQEISEIATSLYKEGHKISRVDVIRKILKEFEILYLQYINKDSKGETLDICRQYSAIIEKDVYLIKGEEKELVRCLDINQEGNLIVRTKNNIKREIISGEVSIRGIKGYV